MDKDTRNAIERATQRARKLLEEDFAAQLVGDFDVHEDGAVAAKAGGHLSARQQFSRERILAAIEHKRAGGMSPADAARDYRRDAAFTTLNRFVALKMLEARELLQECVTKGEQSAGYREFCGMAPGLPLLLAGAGYRLYIESLFDELSTEVKVLFDRRDPSSVLWPKRQTLDDLLAILNAPELAGVWGEDETIGWVYQFFNGQDERKKMREESQAPRNSRELAVRNQFFTPRYVVQFLTDNTLGRIWYEMRRGDTALARTCEYMVRQPSEIWCSPDRGREAWIEQAIRGTWTAIPEGFRWGQSADFAHVINGYDVAPALGLGEAGELANRRQDAAARTGVWEGSAIELWICLFFEHRRYRHFGSEPGDEQLALLDSLCQRLRAALIEEAAAGKAPRLVAPRAKRDPRDLRVLDPACGSGHFLLYAFDVLLAIYEEAFADPESPKSEATGKTLAEDYPSVDALRKAVPGLVLAHNLHGVDIDARCAQIAQLALWMRAQKAYRDFGVVRAERAQIRRSNIVVAEPLVADEQIAKEFVAKLGDAELARVFMSLVESLSLAGDMGLLLRVEQLVKTPPRRQGELFAPPEERIRAALDRFVREEASATSTRRRLFAEDTSYGMGLLAIAERKFDVVLMNPPFGAITAAAKQTLWKGYARSKDDVYGAFVERGLELTPRGGMVGAITSRTGFFLSGFKGWREHILQKDGHLCVFADLGAGVLDSAMVETAAYCVEHRA